MVSCVSPCSSAPLRQHGLWAGPTCSRTYEGGCGNYEQKKLNKEFTDREYTEEECYGLCKAEADCGGFFLGTATEDKKGWCYLVREGCTDDDNPKWDYFAMADCHDGTRCYSGRSHIPPCLIQFPCCFSLFFS